MTILNRRGISEILLPSVALMIISAPLTVFAQNTFPSSGNVGIGTASPVLPLQVNGAMGFNSTENLSANGSGGLELNGHLGVDINANSTNLLTVLNDSNNAEVILRGTNPLLYFTAFGKMIGPYLKTRDGRKTRKNEGRARSFRKCWKDLFKG